jgi:hypothetical protein
MKKFTSGPMRQRRAIGNLHIQRRILPILAVAAGLLTASNASAVILNFTEVSPPPLTPGYTGEGTINGAVYRAIDTHPAGTGVFQPFLTYQNRGIESGYNTSEGGNGQGFLDTKRVPQWNHDLHVSDLAPTTVPGHGTTTYYAFELDANETGTGNINRILSIDQIRIFTSPNNTAATVQENVAAIDANGLGTLRYEMNAAGTSGPNWVLIDASNSEGGSTSGSGSSDLIVYVPTALFAGAGANDFVYFYTINGVHDEAAPGSKSDAGFEEWRALIGPTAVPDGGSTLLLLGSALIPLGLLRARRESNKA